MGSQNRSQYSKHQTLHFLFPLPQKKIKNDLQSRPVFRKNIEILYCTSSKCQFFFLREAASQRFSAIFTALYCFFFSTSKLNHPSRISNLLNRHQLCRTVSRGRSRREKRDRL